MSEGAKPTRRVGIHPSPPPRAIKSSITSEAAPIFLPGEDWIQAQAGPARFLSGTAPGKDRSPRGTSPPPPHQLPPSRRVGPGSPRLRALPLLREAAPGRERRPGPAPLPASPAHKREAGAAGNRTPPR